MDWTGLVVVVVALAAASAYGVLRRSRQGRIATVSSPAESAGESVSPLLAGLGVAPGVVTLVQFSSAFCAPCRATRAVCAQVASTTDGVAHVEVDAESHLDAVRTLDIWRTPTTLIVDRAGRIVGRAQGVPQRAQVLAALTPLLPTAPTVTSLQEQS